MEAINTTNSTKQHFDFEEFVSKNTFTLVMWATISLVFDKLKGCVKKVPNYQLKTKQHGKIYFRIKRKRLD